MQLRIVIRLALVWGLSLAFLDATAAGWSHFVSRRYGFEFSYPSSWHKSNLTNSRPSAKFRFVSPAVAPHAECAVMARPFPPSRHVPQAQINRLTPKTMTESGLKNYLEQGYDNVRIRGFGPTRLGQVVAIGARISYSVGSQRGTQYAMGRALTTITPGRMWVIFCQGRARTAALANRNYHHWQLAINRIISSFRFGAQ